MTTDTPIRAENVVFREIEEEGILYQVEDGRVHVLNGTAYTIWNQCDGEHTIEEIAEGLTETFQVDEQIALKDVRQSVEAFQNLGLLQTCVTTD